MGVPDHKLKDDLHLLLLTMNAGIEKLLIETCKKCISHERRFIRKSEIHLAKR